ncbi:hypothetical protein D3C77_683120 [compost metagenome]
MQADRLEPGRLADHCRPAQRTTGCGQGTSTRHGAFFIAGGENQQRLLEVIGQQRLHGLDNQGEEAFHVAAAKADPTAVDFSQL